MFMVINKEKVYAYVIALSTVAILFAMGSSVIQNRVVVETNAMEKLLPIYKVDTKENKVALTMNCAWDADDIDCILDTLSKNNVHITFFIVGDFARKYPEVIKKIADGGHEIGNHSNTHPHVSKLNLEKNVNEIELCSDEIERITGKKTKLYRAPYGEYNNTVINAAQSLNYKTIQWNIDTLDYTRNYR